MLNQSCTAGYVRLSGFLKYTDYFYGALILAAKENKTMSNAKNLAAVRRLYDSGMAPEVVAEVVADNLEWNVTPGFPAGGVYAGWNAVGNDFFGTLLPQVQQWGAVPENFYGTDEDRVFVDGYYAVTSKAGNEYQVRFIHEWTVEDGTLVRMFQAADSQIAHQAIVDQ